MKDFRNKVAVVTGAASGIGFGIAERCAHEGMKVVLAGINQENLIRAEKALKHTNATMLCVQTDVSNLEDIEALARETLDAFGSVHLLVNNAGVGTTDGSVWESTLEDWQWMMGVNLWGVIYGLRVFVPIMLSQDTECHIVNTSSLGGLLSYHPSAPYHVTKHAVVALSENLYYSLAVKKANIKVSVLCPGWVNTKIVDSERSRPADLRNKAESTPVSPEHNAIEEGFRQAIQAGMSPQEVADYVFEAIVNEQLYILTHSDHNSDVKKRVENILAQRNPL
ncbi:MAG: SDR family NAD(P)-dependent oxidoreductase [Syntrophales bacterium]|nr:SDR family NAD(P)-dependent oxidoreductase [Syntrophales bacterium]